MPEIRVSTPTGAPPLEMDRVTKVYGSGAREGQAAVREVSLRVDPGELLLVEGPSGSGKTTLLALAGGLLAPTSGHVRVAGIAVERLAPRDRPAFRCRHVGFVFQRGLLVEALSVEENLEVALHAAGLFRPESARRARALLERFGVAHCARRAPKSLSGGERQRVAVARAFANEPTLVLADEPTGSLDGAAGRSVMQALAEAAHENGRAVVVVSHDPRIRSFADRILEMVDGCLHA